MDLWILPVWMFRWKYVDLIVISCNAKTRSWVQKVHGSELSHGTSDLHLWHCARRAFMISTQKKYSHKNSCDEHCSTIHVQTCIVFYIKHSRLEPVAILIKSWRLLRHLIRETCYQDIDCFIFNFNFNQDTDQWFQWADWVLKSMH